MPRSRDQKKRLGNDSVTEEFTLTRASKQVKTPAFVIPYIATKEENREKSFSVVNPTGLLKLTHKLTEGDAKPIRLVDASLTVTTDWVCALCQKMSNVHGLGDLFGPYVIQLPKKDWSVASIPIAATKQEGKVTKKQSKVTAADESANHLLDVWFHGCCVLWSPRILLERFTLENPLEHLSDAWKTRCQSLKCNAVGATLACVGKNCTQVYHFHCAQLIGCQFLNESFYVKCPSHSSP